MQLASRLEKNINKQAAVAIATEIIQNEALFTELWTTIRTGEPPLPRRAAWVLESVVARAPWLWQRIYDEAVEVIQEEQHHGAIYRNLMKLFAEQAVPERHESFLYDLALQWVLLPQKPVAVRAHALSLAAKIAAPIPELREEVLLVLQEILEWGEAAIQSRGKKIGKRFSKRS